MSGVQDAGGNRGFWSAARGWLGLAALLVGGPLFIFNPVVQHLVLGWSLFLDRGLSGASFHSETLLVGVVGTAAFFLGLHSFLAWLFRQSQPSVMEGKPRVWRFGASAGIGLLALLMFAAGTAVVGLVHQAFWLTRSRSKIFEFNQAAGSDSLITGALRRDAWRSQSRYNLSSIGLGVRNYSATYQEILPPGGTYRDDGQGLHGWMTPILPYVGYIGPVDETQPWDSAANAIYFRSVIKVYLNPAFAGVYDDRKFALAHYAGNQHLLYPNSSINLDTGIADGLSQTILAGEVYEGFVAWGAPYNVRDPGRGLHQGPETFGGPVRGKTQFVFADGSVRALGDQIDPTVLRALSTPAGQDDAGEYIVGDH